MPRRWLRSGVASEILASRFQVWFTMAPAHLHRLWIASWACFLLSWLLLEASGIRVTIAFSSALSALFGLLVAILCRYRQSFASLMVRLLLDGLQAATTFTATALAACLASYLVVHHAGALADDQLIAADRMIGFDWAAAYQFERSHEAIAMILRVAYESLRLWPLLIIAALLLHGQPARVSAFLHAFAGALIVTLMLAFWLPAECPLVHMLGQANGYIPATGIEYAGVIRGLRAGTIQVIRTDHLLGLIGFPSFHAAGAVLYTWAVWRVPVYRWPMASINLLMLIGTPAEGSHYLVDVVAGCALGGAAAWIAHRMLEAPCRAAPVFDRQGSVAGEQGRFGLLPRRYPFAMSADAPGGV